MELVLEGHGGGAAVFPDADGGTAHRAVAVQHGGGQGREVVLFPDRLEGLGERGIGARSRALPGVAPNQEGREQKGDQPRGAQRAQAPPCFWW